MKLLVKSARARLQYSVDHTEDLLCACSLSKTSELPEWNTADGRRSMRFSSFLAESFLKNRRTKIENFEHYSCTYQQVSNQYDDGRTDVFRLAIHFLTQTQFWLENSHFSVFFHNVCATRSTLMRAHSTQHHPPYPVPTDPWLSHVAVIFARPLHFFHIQ